MFFLFLVARRTRELKASHWRRCATEMTPNFVERLLQLLKIAKQYFGLAGQLLGGARQGVLGEAKRRAILQGRRVRASKTDPDTGISACNECLLKLNDDDVEA
jgi:hypothetical protein